MKSIQFTEAPIISLLELAQAGMKIADLCRRHEIGDATLYGRPPKTEITSHDLAIFVG